jgi:VanZ family protein
MFRTLFWIAVCTVLYFTLRPLTYIVPGSDKTHHAVSFGALMLLAAAAYPRARALAIALALSGVGAAIELIQPWFGRSNDLWDWVADTTGIAVVLLVVLALRRVWPGESVRP